MIGYLSESHLCGVSILNPEPHIAKLSKFSSQIHILSLIKSFMDLANVQKALALLCLMQPKTVCNLCTLYGVQCTVHLLTLDVQAICSIQEVCADVMNQIDSDGDGEVRIIQTRFLWGWLAKGTL